MKAFVDYHHNDLYYSLILLFEKRLGFELYRPIGLDWFNEGYWKIAEPYGNLPETLNQFLSTQPAALDPYTSLNGDRYIQDGIYYCYDRPHKCRHKGITLEQFKNTKFDLIISSITPHDAPFEKLRDAFQPQAKLIAQMGNIGQRTHLKNVLYSAPYNPLPGQNAVYYHQEIDPVCFNYSPPNPNTKNIYSVVNCFPYPELYNTYKAKLPETTMKYFGDGCPDKALPGGAGVGNVMKEANLAWHPKPLGGIGHSTMGWFASGRPLITNMSQHKALGGETLRLFLPGITCIDLDQGTVESNCGLIREWLEPATNAEVGRRVLKQFQEVINYDQEEQAVRKFLERLL